ncbi:V-type ATPase 116kDa subunit family protein [Halomicrobium urmianum]|uniref:V-type ATPase 116kDa subunit family protein n=1 Tax=Halomicrobium urmianum TaxID=1586233 RepID=UPI001CD931DE|nr:V-type ATPase 116kDa subunit family protein [Halomicrobium urmianum]
MLRPEQMSRVSVTGSKRVIDEVIEAVHDLRLLHVTEYDGSWEGFEPGDPIEGAESASEKLVTVRSLQSILDVDEEDAGPTQLVTEEALDEELDQIRREVNDLDDRREELRDELREVEDEIDTLDPYVRLGIDLDLLKGYDTLSVAVGEGDADGVREQLAASDVDDYEVFAEDGVLAAFARADEDDLQDALVGTTFTELEVPEGDVDPEEYREELEHRRQQLQSDLDDVEGELEDLRTDVSGFLLAAEETLTIEVQKREAPLTFATTDNAFVAEGWIPTERYDRFQSELAAAAGDSVEVEELERADYDEGHHEETEPIPEAGSEVTTDYGEPEAAEAAGPTADEDEEAEPREAAPDGGRVTSAGGLITMGDDEPPTVQDNPGGVRPFEALVEVINRPQYTEIDPTFLVFLTFPLFFGFMIGDLGYGLLYMGIGYWLMKSFDSDVVKSLGGVGLWAGGFTALFGVLYGELFGLHQLGYVVWGTEESAGVVGQLFGMHGPPIHKGLQPHYIYYAKAWLLLSVFAGVAHLVIGRVIDFVNNLEHGAGEAFLESGSWIILTLGIWWWVLTTTAMSAKPPFLFSSFAREGMTNPATNEAIEHVAIPLGFNGFDPIAVGPISLQLLVTLVGLALVVYAEGGIGLIESITQGFGHVVSYTRIAAVTLAKAGMALAVNLLVFGAYSEGGEFHLIFFNGMPHTEEAAVIFSGLLNADGAVGLVLGGLVGLLVLVIGHLLVLVLGITSAGLQAVRLEYVEFFGKFYEGGGERYEPFGHERTHTAEE